jgi:hypothetical protein
VIHALALDVAIWAGIVFGVWYAAGKHTERKATPRGDQATARTALDPGVERSDAP